MSNQTPVYNATQKRKNHTFMDKENILERGFTIHNSNTQPSLPGKIIFVILHRYRYLYT